MLAEAAAAGRLVVAFLHGATGELAAALWDRESREDARSQSPGADAALPPAVELLQPGVLLMGSVFLVAPGDVTGLAAGIRAALDMPRCERQRRVLAAQRAVHTRLGLGTFAERTLGVYASLTNEAVGAA